VVMADLYPTPPWEDRTVRDTHVSAIHGALEERDGEGAMGRADASSKDGGAREAKDDRE
jgi:hypothetical protein